MKILRFLAKFLSNYKVKIKMMKFQLIFYFITVLFLYQNFVTSLNYYQKDCLYECENNGICNRTTGQCQCSLR